MTDKPKKKRRTDLHTNRMVNAHYLREELERIMEELHKAEYSLDRDLLRNSLRFVWNQIMLIKDTRGVYLVSDPGEFLTPNEIKAEFYVLAKEVNNHDNP